MFTSGWHWCINFDVIVIDKNNLKFVFEHNKALMYSAGLKMTFELSV